MPLTLRGNNGNPLGPVNIKPKSVFLRFFLAT